MNPLKAVAAPGYDYIVVSPAAVVRLGMLKCKLREGEADSRSVLETPPGAEASSREELRAVQDQQLLSSAIALHSHFAQECLNPGNISSESLIADMSLQNI